MSTAIQTKTKVPPQTSFTPVQNSLVQRKCACGGSAAGSGSCADCGTNQLSLRPKPRGSLESVTTQQSQQSTAVAGSRRSEHNFGAIKVVSAQDRRPDQAFPTITPTGDETQFRTVDPANSAVLQTQAPAAPGPSPAPDHCTPTGSFTSIPSGTVPAIFSGGVFGAAFNMIGEITSAIPCTCTRGEYRQFVRGFAKVNGAKVVHPLCANNMSETVMHEDCMTLGGIDHKYGYHSIPFATSNFSNPDQATGCTFTGEDHPGFPLSSLSSGDSLEMLLEFQGKLVDTVAGTDLASSTWTVEGTGTVP